MTMKINIKDQYIDQFEALLRTLPDDAVVINNISDNSISFEDAQKKVKKSIDNISTKQGISLDTAFEKVINH